MKFWLNTLCLSILVLTACTGTEAISVPTPIEAVTPVTIATATTFTSLPPVPLEVLQDAIPEEPPKGSDVNIYVDDLDEPIAFAFDPNGRLFFTERTGSVRLVVEQVLQPEPLLTVSVATLGEQGMLGIALDPKFETNHHVWVTYVLASEANNGEKLNQVIRFTEQNNTAVDVQVAFTSPNTLETDRHNIGNLAFGSDGKLYVSMGDDMLEYLSQNLEDPRGKILRFEPTIPLKAAADNPLYDGEGPNYDPIYAYGLRNPFDLVLDPLSQELHIFATGNGTSCDDEVNLILPGHNYGWDSDYICRDEQKPNPEINTISPLLTWSPTTAPTGIMVYTGDDFPEWYGDIFFCSFNDALLHHLKLNETRTAVIQHTSVNGMYCQVDVFNGPDGALYFLEGGGYAEGRVKRLFRPES